LEKDGIHCIYKQQYNNLRLELVFFVGEACGSRQLLWSLTCPQSAMSHQCWAANY